MLLELGQPLGCNVVKRRNSFNAEADEKNASLRVAQRPNVIVPARARLALRARARAQKRRAAHSSCPAVSHSVRWTFLPSTSLSVSKLSNTVGMYSNGGWPLTSECSMLVLPTAAYAPFVLALCVRVRARARMRVCVCARARAHARDHAPPSPTTTILQISSELMATLRPR